MDERSLKGENLDAIKVGGRGPSRRFDRRVTNWGFRANCPGSPERKANVVGKRQLDDEKKGEGGENGGPDGYLSILRRTNRPYQHKDPQTIDPGGRRRPTISERGKKRKLSQGFL